MLSPTRPFQNLISPKRQKHGGLSPRWMVNRPTQALRLFEKPEDERATCSSTTG